MYLDRRQLILGATAFAGLAGFASTGHAAVDLAALHAPPAEGDMSMGPETAKVTVIEYASASCPHCANFLQDDLPGPEKGIYRHRQDPLHLPRVPAQPAGARRLHAGALRAQGKIFPADRYVLRSSRTAGSQTPLEGLQKIAQLAGFTKESFDACLKNEAVAKGIIAVRDAGGEGVRGGIDSDLLYQWRADQGRNDDRRFPEDDRSAALGAGIAYRFLD